MSKCVSKVRVYEYECSYKVHLVIYIVKMLLVSVNKLSSLCGGSCFPLLIFQYLLVAWLAWDGNHCLLAAGQLLQSPPMSFVFLPRASKPDIVSKSALTDFTPFDVDGRRCILE